VVCLAMWSVIPASLCRSSRPATIARTRPSGTMPFLPAPCEYACPSGIPTQDRINLLRKGKIREALELVLNYNPFPGSVCGAACSNPCMTACTRQAIDFAVLAGPLGKVSMESARAASRAPHRQKIRHIGSGVGGLSAAWQLRCAGRGDPL